MYNNSYRLNPDKPYFMEKLVSALSYLTMGFVGFIYLVIVILTKKNLKPFLKYHIFQSIFISIGYYLLTIFIGLVCNILLFIPLINKITTMILYYTTLNIIFGCSIIGLFVYAVLFYLVITSFQGKYSYIPWVSDIIKMNVR